MTVVYAMRRRSYSTSKTLRTVSTDSAGLPPHDLHDVCFEVPGHLSDARAIGAEHADVRLETQGILRHARFFHERPTGPIMRFIISRMPSSGCASSPPRAEPSRMPGII